MSLSNRRKGTGGNCADRFNHSTDRRFDCSPGFTTAIKVLFFFKKEKENSLEHLEKGSMKMECVPVIAYLDG